MPLPLIPIGVGIAAGWIGSQLLGGGTKKEQTVVSTQETYAPTITYPYAQYAPTITKTYQPVSSYQLDYMYAPSVVIDSPQTTISPLQETKKDATQTPTVIVMPTTEQSVSPTVSPVQTTEAGQFDLGGLLIPALLVGGAVVIGYALLKKKKKKGG